MLAVALAHLSMIAWVRGHGFVAISDDDYSRVVIAQATAASPRLNPSGTSWLPFPFWVQAIPLAVFGKTLGVARATGWVLSALSRALVFPAALWFGAAPAWAFTAALMCALFPNAVWVGATPVPEAYVAALCVFGLGSTLVTRDSLRLSGALALSAAALSRYEAWPLAALGAWWFLVRPGASRRPALVALTGPALWMLGGWCQHGSPWFFVTRVANYRQALGAGSVDWMSALLNFPQRFLNAEAAVVTFAALGVLVSSRRPWPQGHRRAAYAAAALVVFLAVGDLKDGAPTHHPERALLPAWFLATVLGALCWQSSFQRIGARVTLGLGAVLACVVAGTAWQLSPTREASSFIDRHLEEDIGRRSHVVGAGRVGVGASGYGYFAMMAALARPGQAVPLNSHDPRVQEVDAMASPEALHQRVDELRLDWLIVDRTRLPIAAPLGRVVAENEQFSLLKLD